MTEREIQLLPTMRTPRNTAIQTLSQFLKKTTAADVTGKRRLGSRACVGFAFSIFDCQGDKYIYHDCTRLNNPYIDGTLGGKERKKYIHPNLNNTANINGRYNNVL